ncbi:MAG: MarR family transcriptional regulator [Burkholderiales bacterium]|nr:MarR family transcriptional regulator [Burkholderiales bacterium]
MTVKLAITEPVISEIEPEDKNLIGPQLAKVTNRLRRYLDNEMKIFDLSRTQWQVLCILRKTGPCSQQDLLSNLDIDAPHLARVLDKLENRHYISREKLTGDRRALFIKMTPLAMKQLVPHFTRIHAKEHHVLLEGLTNPEIQKLSKLLKKLENNMNVALQNTVKEQIDE